jgi:hypothetical protein
MAKKKNNIDTVNLLIQSLIHGHTFYSLLPQKLRNKYAILRNSHHAGKKSLAKPA